MKTSKPVLFLLIAVVAVCAGTYAQSERTDNAHVAGARTRLFSSDLGYELSYPAEWVYVDLGPVMPAAKMALDKQSESDPYRRSIECSQNIFSARFGEPRSNFLSGAITTECMREKPDLDTFTSRTMRLLEGGYQLSDTHYAAYSVQGQMFWVMRSKAVSRNEPEETETIEYVATVLPKGLVYWWVHSKIPQAQEDFEHSHLHLANGVDTDLIPNEAFAPSNDVLASSDQQAPVLPAISMNAAPEQSAAPKAAPEPAAAQKAAPKPSAAPKTPPDYSAEPIVIEHLEHIYTMAADGTGVRLLTVAARVNSDASVRQLGVLSIPYASSSEHVELAYVRVRRPEIGRAH